MPKARTAYILLFRGVGGATQLPTAPLREALTEAGFENVATYINSGNAVLRSPLSREKVIASVAKICEDRFGFTKAIYAPTLAEWETLIANNPFPDFEIPKFLHAAVLAGDPTRKRSSDSGHTRATARGSRSSAGWPTCTLRTGSARRSWARNSTSGSAWTTPPATGTRCSSCWSW
jgi:hypothetical protein